MAPPPESTRIGFCERGTATAFFAVMQIRLSEEGWLAFTELSAARELVTKAARELDRGDADARVFLSAALRQEEEAKARFAAAMSSEVTS